MRHNRDLAGLTVEAQLFGTLRDLATLGVGVATQSGLVLVDVLPRSDGHVHTHLALEAESGRAVETLHELPERQRSADGVRVALPQRVVRRVDVPERAGDVRSGAACTDHLLGAAALETDVVAGGDRLKLRLEAGDRHGAGARIDSRDLDVGRRVALRAVGVVDVDVAVLEAGPDGGRPRSLRDDERAGAGAFVSRGEDLTEVVDRAGRRGVGASAAAPEEHYLADERTSLNRGLDLVLGRVGESLLAARDSLLHCAVRQLRLQHVLCAVQARVLRLIRLGTVKGEGRAIEVERVAVLAGEQDGNVVRQALTLCVRNELDIICQPVNLRNRTSNFVAVHFLEHTGHLVNASRLRHFGILGKSRENGWFSLPTYLGSGRSLARSDPALRPRARRPSGLGVNAYRDCSTDDTSKQIKNPRPHTMRDRGILEEPAGSCQLRWPADDQVLTWDGGGVKG